MITLVYTFYRKRNNAYSIIILAAEYWAACSIYNSASEAASTFFQMSLSVEAEMMKKFWFYWHIEAYFVNTINRELKIATLCLTSDICICDYINGNIRNIIATSKFSYVTKSIITYLTPINSRQQGFCKCEFELKC